MKLKNLLPSAILLAIGLSPSRLLAQTFTFNTIAGGSAGLVNGYDTSAEMHDPTGVVVATNGNLYIADRDNNAIRQATPLGTDWIISTIAGGVQGSANGVGAAAQFYAPSGIAMDNSGNLYVSDQYNGTIRELVLSGTNWTVSTIAGTPGVSGFANGLNASAQFADPAGIAVDGSGNLYVADEVNNAIRKITPTNGSWLVTTIAGGTKGSSDGVNTAAQFAGPAGVALDASGRIYIADQFNNTVRLMTLSGTNWTVTTIAGQTIAGRTDGTGTSALFDAPVGLTVDSGGNVYVADMFNNAIRKMTLVSGNWSVITIAGGTSGSANGSGTSAQFNLPYGVAADGFGDVFVADSQNNTMRLGVATGSAAATGSVQVFLTPTNAIKAGAKWQMDGAGAAQTNGAIVTGLTPGSHYVNFYSATNFTIPGEHIFQVTAHQTVAATITYTAAVANNGALEVYLSPVGVINAGGQWRVDNGAWQTNGATVAPVTNGTHTISFMPIANWTTPSNQTVSISSSLTSVNTGTYVAQAGSVTVNLLPSNAVTAGAKWQVDGGTLQASGATIAGLTPGPHTIAFNTVLGWNTPGSQTISITNNATTAVSATYSAAGTSAPFQISGMGSAGGSFQFTLSGTPNTSCTVQYSSDLVHWSSLSSVTISGGGSVLVTDSTASGQSYRFYRASHP